MPCLKKIRNNLAGLTTFCGRSNIALNDMHSYICYIAADDQSESSIEIASCSRMRHIHGDLNYRMSSTESAHTPFVTVETPVFEWLSMKTKQSM